MTRLRRSVYRTYAPLLGALVVASVSPAQTPTVSDSVAAVLQHHGYQAVPVASYSGDGLYTVQIAVDSSPVTLLFDSGFNGELTLTQTKAEVLGIHGAAARSGDGAAGAAPAETTHIRHATIGAMQLGSLSVSLGRFPMAEGAVGARLMSAYNAVLDYPHDTLYVQSQWDSTVPRHALKRSSDIAIPLQRVVKGAKAVYLVRGAVEGKPVTLLLNTGWGKNSDGPTLDAGRAETLGVSALSKVQLTLGPLEMGELPLYTSDLSRTQQECQSEGFPKIDGVLGAAVLKKRGALVDFAREVLYLRER